MTNTKVWKKEEILNFLNHNNKNIRKKAVLKGLIAIYNLQTSEEKETKETKENNGVGFTGVDSNILTSISQWYIEKGFVTPGQYTIIEKKIKKYARQLTNISNKNEAEKVKKVEVKKVEVEKEEKELYSLEDFIIRFTNNRDLNFINRAGLDQYLKYYWVVRDNSINLIDNNKKRLIIKEYQKKYKTHGTTVGSYKQATLRVPTLRKLLNNKKFIAKINQKIRILKKLQGLHLRAENEKNIDRKQQISNRLNKLQAKYKI